MKTKALFLIFILFVSLSTLQAQKRIGYILEMDSIMKHQYLGISSFQNFSNTYSMPFELENFSNEKLIEIFENSSIQLVKLEEGIYQDYLNEKKKLSRKEKKQSGQKWFDELKKKYEIDYFIYIHSCELEPYQQENININLGRIGFMQSNKQTFIKVYLQLEFMVFSENKPVSIKAKTRFYKKDSFPSLRAKTALFTEEELIQTKESYENLILLQLQEIKGSKKFNQLMEKE